MPLQPPTARSRNLLFSRLLTQAVGHDPVRYRDLIAGPNPQPTRSSVPADRCNPPSDAAGVAQAPEGLTRTAALRRALDAATEHAIAEASALSWSVTTIAVAHRPTTICDADVVLCPDKGRAVQPGTFEEVRASVPGFEVQAQLLRL